MYLFIYWFICKAERLRWRPAVHWITPQMPKQLGLSQTEAKNLELDLSLPVRYQGV